MRPTRRVVPALALTWLPVAVTAATWPSWSQRLESSIATHWGIGGPADGFGSATGFWVSMLALGLVAGLVALVVGIRAGNTAGRRFALTGAASVTGGSAGLWVSVATINLADPADPRLGWRLGWFFLGLAWCLVVHRVLGPADPQPVPAPTDRLDLGPTERAAFSTTLSSPLLSAVTGIAAVAIAVGAATGSPGLWFVMLIPATVALFFGRIRVTADRRGLRLVAALIGVPVRRIPLSAITGAEADVIEPGAWGGWGYRITPGASALVLRRGPGLILHLRGGNRFVVTLDAPEVPAGLLNALRERSAG